MPNLTLDEAVREAECRIQGASDTKATALNLRGLGLPRLPESLRQLTQLQNLDVSFNRLGALPEFLVQLTELQELIISHNELSRLPEWIGRLTRLQRLHAGHNQLTMLPESVSELTQLQLLTVTNNQLTALPESIGKLLQLEALFVLDNRLVRLPESLRRLTALTQLYLHGNNALGLPPEVLGPKAMEIDEKNAPTSPAMILNYYFRVRSGPQQLNEAKIIFIGRGGVGKTSLIRRLTRNAFDTRELETEGIDIQPWLVSLQDGDIVRLHVWDLGGQEILHSTHQFFLTERTLYVLVLSGREGNPTEDAGYWLQLVKSFGGESHVIIALNKQHQHPFDVNRGLLREKYPFVAEFVKTDCEDGLGLSELRRSISTEADAMEHRKALFPADWFTIKERLASMAEDFVSWEDYQKICRDLGESDPQAQRDLAKFLHILGVALSYADDPRLQDTRVLKPRWVTEGIYSLLRAGHRENNGGILHRGDLERALDQRRYPPSKHDFLLRLMERFQLCFRLPGQKERYLLPELLSENQPDLKALLDAPGLGFRYQYEILPQGLLPRFIVQTHWYSETNPQWRWRSGVVLERGGCRAVIRADIRERRVDIHVIGPSPLTRQLLEIIRERFDELHRELKGLAVQERVPLPGERGVTVGYLDLLRREERGETAFYPEDMDRAVSVQELLNGVEAPDIRKARLLSKVSSISDALEKIGEENMLLQTTITKSGTRQERRDQGNRGRDS